MIGKPEHLPRLRRRSNYGTYRYYNGYRSEIREDCRYRCVYCDLHERDIGGERLMSLDHFRPQSKYPSLLRDPHNLMWACRGCNQLKANDWPAYGLPGNPTVNGAEGYIDPFDEDRRDYIDVTDDGEFKARKSPAAYMIRFLELNRSGRREIRALRRLVYNMAMALLEEFSSDIDTFESIRDDESMGERDRLQWIENRPHLKEFLEATGKWYDDFPVE